MASLYEILSDAQQGEAIAGLGREFGLSPQQTQAAVDSLLPAISMGLKQSTATPEELGDLLAIMGRQTDIHSMHSDPKAAFSRQGRAAGNEVLAKMFGSPEASRAIADQAQQSSDILKKLLPILAGILISGLMRSGSGQASPSAPQTSPDQGGGLIDILRQIFGQGATEPTGQTSSPAPSGPAPAPTDGGSLGDKLGPGRDYQVPGSGQPGPPTDPGGQAIPGGDVLGQILSELGKATRKVASSRS
jgi:hypothetical protein